MLKKTPASARKIARSMINNLNLCPSELQNAEKARFFLKRLPMFSGETQQAIIIRSILYTAKHHPSYADRFARIEADFEELINKAD